jgi:hypothetical protein
VTLEEFRDSARHAAPPAGATPALVALWHDARGEWNEAHQTVQDIETTEAAWIHAYLHRKEGDLANAGYWYRRAGKPEFKGSLDSEWTSIAGAMLGT